MRKSVILTMVRHGETNLNVQKVIQGQVEAPLNEKGKIQSQLLGKHISDNKYSRIYSSDLERAHLTAKIILEHSNHLKGFPIFLDKRLRERGYGSIEMKPFTELTRMIKESGENPHIFTPEGGETYQNVQNRIESFFNDIFEIAVNNESDEEEKILIVTHAGFIRLMFEHLHSSTEHYILNNFNVEKAFAFSANTAVTQFEIQVPVSNQNSVADSPKHFNFIQIYDTARAHLTHTL